MSIHIISPQDWQSQSWKNGGGITYQLARCDDAAGMRWRVSIAEVALDGPFSQFAGINRIILLLQGQGFCLHGVGDAPQVLDTALQPFAFAGERTIHCQLIKGPVRDFNLMTRRADTQASLQLLSYSPTPHTLTLATDTLLFVAKGQAAIHYNGTDHWLETEHSLLLSNETGELQLSSGSADMRVLLLHLSSGSGSNPD